MTFYSCTFSVILKREHFQCDTFSIKRKSNTVLQGYLGLLPYYLVFFRDQNSNTSNVEVEGSGIFSVSRSFVFAFHTNYFRLEIYRDYMKNLCINEEIDRKLPEI
jgi:hypothetical protein